MQRKFQLWLGSILAKMARNLHSPSFTLHPTGWGVTCCRNPQTTGCPASQSSEAFRVFFVFLSFAHQRRHCSAYPVLCFSRTLHLTSLGSENKWTDYYKCNSSLNICLRVHSLIQCISAADYHRWCIWWICWCIASYHFCLFYLHHCRLELIARWCISVTRCTCCNASKVKASLGPH